MQKITKKLAREIQKEFYKGFNTRGYKEIDILFRDFGDYALIFKIGQWTEEKEKNTYDYDALIVNKDLQVVYDESDGELPLPRILGIFNYDFIKPKFYDN